MSTVGAHHQHAPRGVAEVVVAAAAAPQSFGPALHSPWSARGSRGKDDERRPNLADGGGAGPGIQVGAGAASGVVRRLSELEVRAC